MNIQLLDPQHFSVTYQTDCLVKIAGRNINNVRYADDTNLMAESEEELKSHFMKVKVDCLPGCVWNAAWGASFPSERALPAGGFGSVHTPSP